MRRLRRHGGDRPLPLLACECSGKTGGCRLGGLEEAWSRSPCEEYLTRPALVGYKATCTDLPDGNATVVETGRYLTIFHTNLPVSCARLRTG
ncbi:hypothetical protein BQ8420_18345 [Nocardiopsis sp. JB363]|nr:hypothetical protein BQ8420_18345 [Nocardiopsis sp. JB363]